MRTLLGNELSPRQRHQTCRHCRRVMPVACVTDATDRLTDRVDKSIYHLPLVPLTLKMPTCNQVGFLLLKGGPGQGSLRSSLLPSQIDKAAAHPPAESLGGIREGQGRKQSTNERSERVPLAPQAPEAPENLEDSRKLREENQKPRSRKVGILESWKVEKLVG